MNWTYQSTMRGEEWTRGPWLALKRRGDNIFNLFHEGVLKALAFIDAK